MAKSALEKQLEKAQRDQKRQAQKDAMRQRAASIVSGQPIVGGMRIMDTAAEEVLTSLLEKGDIRDGNRVSFNGDIFPEYAQRTLSTELEKLTQYGMIANVSLWISGGGQLVLLPQAFTYFKNKEDILNASETKNDSEAISNNKIFIVHGHDDAAKIEMARTLEKAGFEAIILHEQPDAGRTIIEKIEAYTDVAFAVVLYTGCDLGRAKEDKIENEKFRARQNVVFEHGYLIGKLGRKNVCALVKGDVETPGDISGVVYTSMDAAGAWKIQMFKNIKEAGLDVDFNKII